MRLKIYWDARWVVRDLIVKALVVAVLPLPGGTPRTLIIMCSGLSEVIAFLTSRQESVRLVMLSVVLSLDTVVR